VVSIGFAGSGLIIWWTQHRKIRDQIDKTAFRCDDGLLAKGAEQTLVRPLFFISAGVRVEELRETVRPGLMETMRRELRETVRRCDDKTAASALDYKPPALADFDNRSFCFTLVERY
jgi:hypothetical protein